MILIDLMIRRGRPILLLLLYLYSDGITGAAKLTVLCECECMMKTKKLIFLYIFHFLISNYQNHMNDPDGLGIWRDETTGWLTRNQLGTANNWFCWMELLLLLLKYLIWFNFILHSIMIIYSMYNIPHPPNPRTANRRHWPGQRDHPTNSEER